METLQKLKVGLASFTAGALALTSLTAMAEGFNGVFGFRGGNDTNVAVENQDGDDNGGLTVGSRTNADAAGRVNADKKDDSAAADLDSRAGNDTSLSVTRGDDRGSMSADSRSWLDTAASANVSDDEDYDHSSSSASTTSSSSSANGGNSSSSSSVNSSSSVSSTSSSEHHDEDSRDGILDDVFGGLGL